MALQFELQKINTLRSADPQSRDTVILYQMGKVGSQSLRKSIEAAGRPCVNLYSLGRPTLAQAAKGLDFPARRYQVLGGIRRAVYSRLIRSGGRSRIITVVRDPVARDLSLLYHFLSVFIYNAIGQSTADEFDMQSLIQRIYDEYLIHGSACSWFDEEYKKSLGVDIYEHPFDRERGCGLIRSGNMEILLLTLEKLGENEETIGAFLELPHFKLMPTNRAEMKWYRPIYETTKDSIRFDKEEIEAIYSSRFVQYFYSEQEIETRKAERLARCRQEQS